MDGNTSIDVANTTPTTDDSGSTWWNERFLSTKFIIVLIITVVGCVALLTGKFDPASFNWLAAIILTGHGASNILDKRFNRDQ